jgi:hypothetical protein
LCLFSSLFPFYSSCSSALVLPPPLMFPILTDLFPECYDPCGCLFRVWRLRAFAASC